MAFSVLLRLKKSSFFLVEWIWHLIMIRTKISKSSKGQWVVRGHGQPIPRKKIQWHGAYVALVWLHFVVEDPFESILDDDIVKNSGHILKLLFFKWRLTSSNQSPKRTQILQLHFICSCKEFNGVVHAVTPHNDILIWHTGSAYFDTENIFC